MSLSLVGPGPAQELREGEAVTLKSGDAGEVKIEVRVVPRPETQRYTADFRVRGGGGVAGAFTVKLAVPVLANVRAVPPVVAHEFGPGASGPVEARVRIERSVPAQGAGADPEILGLPPEAELVRLERREAAQAGPGLWHHAWDATLRLRPAPTAGWRRRPASTFRTRPS